MKKWVKWTLGIILFLVLTIVALYVIRLYQIKKFNENFIPAQHETQQSILDYARQKQLSGEILIAKDTTGFEKVAHLFAPGTIFVLDKQKKIVDINYGNYGGSCYFDIADHICDDFNFSKSKYNHKIVDTTFLSDLTTSTAFITNFTWDSARNYDYIVTFCWAKWDSTSYSNEGAVQKIINGIKSNTKRKVLLLSVNADCVAPWYPLDTELPVTKR